MITIFNIESVMCDPGRPRGPRESQPGCPERCCPDPKGGGGGGGAYVCVFKCLCVCVRVSV
jgi:hypothetical protein